MHLVGGHIHFIFDIPLLIIIDLYMKSRYVYINIFICYIYRIYIILLGWGSGRILNSADAIYIIYIYIYITYIMHGCFQIPGMFGEILYSYIYIYI